MEILISKEGDRHADKSDRPLCCCFLNRKRQSPLLATIASSGEIISDRQEVIRTEFDMTGNGLAAVGNGLATVGVVSERL
jgi:hypothetical protein